MDEYSNRRSSGGLAVSRRGPSLVLRETAQNNRDKNVQVCSRIGCGSRLNSMKDAQTGSPSKVKTPKTPFRSSALGKESIGTSSRTPASPNTSKKSISGSKKKLSSHLDTDSETCSLQEESEKISGKTQMRVHPEPEDHEHPEATSSEAGSSSSGSTSKFAKKSAPRFGLGRQDSASSSSTSFGFKQANQGARNGGASTSRYNLRNLKCNSISDVVPSGSSLSPQSNVSKKGETGGRKRVGEAESSLPVRGKKMNGTILDDQRNDYSNRGISISDSRRTRSSSPGNNDSAPVRTRRSSARTRLSNQESRDRLPLVGSPRMSPSSPQPDLTTDETDFSSENQFSVQTSASYSNPLVRQGSGSEHMLPNRSSDPYGAGIARSFMNRDALRQYDLDGIAEMLLALERIEQEEEPTYEQLLVLESNLFLGGLSFHDQHRDMRLDIDNMSYEELLALEERMGTVSTAVPENVLANCLKRSIYQGISECREDENDVKCSICQEEYADTEELGRLSCNHRYHFECINQWLKLKNWCPVCKNSVAPPPPASLPP
ncbi:E3 ubiquitin-protein ligase RNF12-like [Chenopodium quinoa]|uniref:RING-type E3 ubiquitin transferase n=1 Tax=Chenopodium quinoa TaxID=63459 RepID=A0A803LYP8_CHEQI|nr:E3 ubiquitin-protein ligase RNF12-like [Chenopodium quinoa]XP_021744458.1 E3 ubiquitin-protein ligase RNF12-like [Chenopodium quinoa]XP_021744459.1 E3 ubiquitin-protein ligase RNF12-like [Chenopodium quinoa]XP_021744460.1 E3 ubiquitin-protein ligase RNF12-like [Chenopodium quinoa]